VGTFALFLDLERVIEAADGAKCLKQVVKERLKLFVKLMAILRAWASHALVNLLLDVIIVDWRHCGHLRRIEVGEDVGCATTNTMELWGILVACQYGATTATFASILGDLG